MTSSKILTFDPPTRGPSVTVFRESTEDIRLHEVEVHGLPVSKWKGKTCIKRFFKQIYFNQCFCHTRCFLFQDSEESIDLFQEVRYKPWAEVFSNLTQCTSLVSLTTNKVCNIRNQNSFYLSFLVFIVSFHHGRKALCFKDRTRYKLSTLGKKIAWDWEFTGKNV